MNTLWTRGPRPALLLLTSAIGLLGAEPAHAPVALRDPLQDKNFFLLSATERTPAVRSLVQSDPALARIAAAKRSTLSDAPRACVADVACYANAMRWTDDEIGV